MIKWLERLLAKPGHQPTTDGPKGPPPNQASAASPPDFIGFVNPNYRPGKR